MKKNLLSLMLSLVLIAASVLTFTACGKQISDADPTAAATALSGAEETPGTEENVVGEGSVRFAFTVTFPDGSEKAYTVCTDKPTVGQALQDAGLIAGEEGAYGLYVKTVAGVSLDYAKDGKYWAFYENGQYASAGVDTTNVQAGTAYAFKAE